MAAIIATDLEEAFGIGGASTPYSGADDRPLFEAGQVVFNLGDFPASAAADNMNIDHKSYTIVDVVVIPQTEGGVTKFMDQTLTFATSAVSDSGSTTRSVLGWAHTTSPAATTTATTASSPWFYNVQDEEGTLFVMSIKCN